MGESVTPSRPQESRTKSNRRKAIRGLRQRRAYYRCCIPALAGFVSLRSIAPDGSIQMDQLRQNGNVILALSRIAIVFKLLHFRFGGCRRKESLGCPDGWDSQIYRRLESIIQSKNGKVSPHYRDFMRVGRRNSGFCESCQVVTDASGVER